MKLQFVQNVTGTDTDRIFLARRVNIGKDNNIRKRENIRKVIEKCLRAGVGVRLEYQNQTLVRIVGSGSKRSANLGRMVCVIVDDRNAVDRTLVLEAAVCTVEDQKSFLNMCKGNTGKRAACNRSQSIGDIVKPRNMQCQCAERFALVHNRKGCAALLIKLNICCGKITAAVKPECDDGARKPAGDLLVVVDRTVDDQCTIRLCVLCKKPEGMTDIGKILKEIQMLCLNVEDDAVFRTEIQKAVRVLTCLRQKRLGVADAQIAAERFEDTSDRDGRIGVCREQDLADHGGGRGLSVRAGNCDGLIVIVHDLTEQLGACQHRDMLLLCSLPLRIILADRRSVYNKINAVYNVIGTLSVKNLNAFLVEMACQIRFLGIGTGYGKSFLCQDLGETAHADAADADEVNVYRMFKV